jgi:hypothetical protein
LIIFFRSPTIPGGLGGYDLWMASRPDRASPFDTVRNLAEINTAAHDICPSISPDGLALIFQSGTYGDWQFFRVIRQSLTEPFGNIELLSIPGIPGYTNNHPSLSNDGSTLYFMRHIEVDRSTADIYVSYLDTGPEPGPIAHWKFDEGEGSIAYDSAGNNDGTIYGAQWTTGQVDGALSFDGVNDYVEVTYNDVYQLPVFTVSTWVYMASSDLKGAILTRGEDVTSDNAALIFTISDWGGVLLTYENNSDQSQDFPTNYRPPSDTWTHLAASRAQDGEIQIYANGVSIGQWGSSATPSDNCYQNILIGAYWYNPPGGAYVTGFFPGRIDDVSIYDRALSAEEIWDIYVWPPIKLSSIDIKPGSCPNPLNVKSRGVLPVAVLGSEDFDVSTIDAASIRLAGVAPNRSSYEDVAAPVSDSNECECSAEGPDGFFDLTLKFETQRIVEEIGEVDHGDELVLELTGVLSDETPIEGSDCVIIRGKHKPLNRADFNGDGIVGMADFAAFAENWLQSSIVEY